MDQHFLTWKRFLLIENAISQGNLDEGLRAYISSGLDEIEALEEELHRRQVTLVDSQET